MKKLFSFAAVSLVLLAGSALGAEFQPLGTLGIGGAGVARPQGALTAYWNPAGGAFNQGNVSMIVGGQFGIRGNDALTQNVDRLDDIDFDSVENFNNGSGTAQTVGDMIKLISIMDDIKRRDGHMAITASAPIGFASKRFSFGVFGNLEGYAQPLPDTVNILPLVNGTGASVTATDMYNAVKDDPSAATSHGYFSPVQYAAMVNVFRDNGLAAPGQAEAVVNAIEAQMINSGIPASTVAAATTTSLGATLANPAGATLNKNTTSVINKALFYLEFPLAYGHPIPLGKYGVLGVGATVKIIRGTVYQNQVLLVNNGSISSSDLFKDLTNNKESTVTWGVDLGALWKYDKVSVGLVAKNLNSPKFSAPTYQEPFYNPDTGTIEKRSRKGSDVSLDPQVRGGVAYTPWNWLTVAADLDLTENDAVVPSSAVKSRNLGGGLEFHPASWFKFRMGAYKNLAISEVGPVITTGISLGPLDLDGSLSTDTFKIDGNTYPQEAKVQLLCGFTF